MAIEGMSHGVLILIASITLFWIIFAVLFGRGVWRRLTGGGRRNNNAGGGVAGRTHNTDCPICLEPVTEESGITTLCGHSYCTRCWVMLAQRERARTARWIVRCAYCRRPVTYLERFSALGGDAARAVVAAYNLRAAAHRWPWARAVLDAPLLLRRLWRDVRARPWRVVVLLYRAKYFFWCVGMALYVVSPFDLIPEAVFGIVGLMDDLIVLAALAVVLGISYRAALLSRWVRGEHAQGAAAGGRPPATNGRGHQHRGAMNGGGHQD